MHDWTSAPFLRCGKYLHQVLTVATVVARDANETVLERMVESGGVCF